MNIKPTHLIGSKICVACSGGVDSMVLCHWLMEYGIPFSIAHCNFNLRGEESDKDLEFVKTFALRHDLPFYSKSFDTERLARESKKSFEMEARDLRYEFFNQLTAEHKFDKILLAHHAGDKAETILMRIISGTGIEGLKGMSDFKSPNIFRPLLDISKAEILDYAQENKIEFRQDESNFDSKYTRNKIRNEILPKINEINPSYSEAFFKISDIANQVDLLLKDQFQIQKKSWIEQGLVNLSAYKTSDYTSLIISFIIQDNTLNRDQVCKIAKALRSTEKKIFILNNDTIEVKNGIISKQIK